jgi:hypothetical protein
VATAGARRVCYLLTALADALQNVSETSGPTWHANRLAEPKTRSLASKGIDGCNAVYQRTETWGRSSWASSGSGRTDPRRPGR